MELDASGYLHMWLGAGQAQQEGREKICDQKITRLFILLGIYCSHIFINYFIKLTAVCAAEFST